MGFSFVLAPTSISPTHPQNAPLCFPRPQKSTISFSEFNGAHGIIAGCLVALTQVMPDQDVSWGGNGGGGIRVKHLLGGYIVAATVISVFTKSLLSTLPVVLMGAYSSWLYLRFVQVKEGLGLRYVRERGEKERAGVEEGLPSE